MFFVEPASRTQSDASLGSDTKGRAFDVVSIKPNNSGKLGRAWGVSQNKYSAKNTPLAFVILQAYLGFSPSTERLKGAPAWVMSDAYDITAKVDDATANEWKGLKAAQQAAMAAPMLRTMLRERCKLVVHTEPTEIQGYALVVGRHGMKMKEAQPDEAVPTAHVTFEGGWKMVPIQPGPDAKNSVSFLQVTMAEFTAFLSVGSYPIVDQTGLMGKYDFELPRFDVSLSAEDGSALAPPHPDIAHMYDWNAIGLEMRPIKVPAVNLVIDHIEKPSEN
jgi:uncharacterized protein (TIGR03435 family)